MPRVSPEQRQKMEQDGKWGPFKARKQELQTTGGRTPGQAHVTALAEFCPPDDVVPRGSCTEVEPSRADAVQVTALEAKLAEFVRLFVGCIPDQCVPRESPEERPNYPLGLAWHDTANALAEAEDQIENLGDLIRGKAGITLGEARAAIAESQEQPATAELVST